MMMKFPGADKFVNRMFRRADNVVWDMMTGKIGVITSDGIASLEQTTDAENKPQFKVVVNVFDNFGVPLPAFAQATPLSEVNVGDIICRTNESVAWVIEVGGTRFRILKQNGEEGWFNPPKTQMLGFDSGVMILRPLFNMLPGGAAGVNNMSSALMPLMMMTGMTGESPDLEAMMPLLLMSQMNAGADPNAGAGMSQMLNMMMMFKMLKGDTDQASGAIKPKRMGNMQSTIFDRR